jgi:hypothetical protein
MSSESNQVEINQLTEKIIACVYCVGNTLGSEFLEKVYGNALVSVAMIRI